MTEFASIKRTEQLIDKLMDDHAMTIDALLKMSNAARDGAMNDTEFRAYSRYTAFMALRALTSAMSIEK